jgi:hypothetical protein
MSMVPTKALLVLQLEHSDVLLVVKGALPQRGNSFTRSVISTTHRAMHRLQLN